MKPKRFNGFPPGKVKFTPIPGPFFSDLLPQIDHLGELKVSIYAWWFLDKQTGNVRFFRESDLANDSIFMAGMGDTPETALETLRESLRRAVRRGTFLRSVFLLEEDKEIAVYFLNSPKGRKVWQAAQRGEWKPSVHDTLPIELSREKPNIYQLYEEHIGPLSPMIADMLKDAEETYPQSWIEKAVRIAVKANVRSWNYIEKILRNWQEGKDNARKPRGDSEEDRRKYVEGEFADFIE